MKPRRTHPLKAFREKHKLTQVEAAQRFGMAQSEWSRLERGLCRPNREITKRLLAETGVPLEVLMGIAS